MALFNNYSSNQGLSINHYRSHGYDNSDVMGLVDDIVANQNGHCPLDGVKDAINDSSLWDDNVQPILEDIAEFIREYEFERGIEV